MKQIKNYKLRITNYAKGQARLHRYAKHCGQVVLAVLLVSAVIMTITMAMTKKTVVQMKINTDEELLKQAFNNAESGLEYYKKTKLTSYSVGSTVLAVIKPNSGGATKEHIGEVAKMNNPEYLWLVGHTGKGAIDYRVSYGDSTISVIAEKEGFTGSLKVDLFYCESDCERGGKYMVQRTGYNCDSDRVSGYTKKTCKSIDVDIPSGGKPILLAVTPLFDNTIISFRGTDNLPDQGEKIESTGTKNGVKSVVSVSRRFVVPTFLLDAIVAEGDVRIEKGE